ncbi:MAG: ArnT family glycosyltransferase [Armatimonadota bacterium]
MARELAEVLTRGRRPVPVAQALLAGLIAAMAFGAYLARTDFHVLPREDVIECVVAAEQINAGEGMTTRVISPSVLSFLQERGRSQPPWPNLLRSPLPCLTIAWLMRVTSQAGAVALSSGIFFVLSVPLIFAIAYRLAGRAARWLAAITYTVSRAGLWFGSTGLNESATIFALAGIVWCLMPPLGWRACLAAGVFAGVGYLARSTFTLWALLMVLYILWQSRSGGLGRALGHAVIFCLPLATAWWWWGATLGAMTGEFGASGQDDIIIRLDTDLYPGRSASLVLEHWTPLEFVRRHPGEVARKYGRIATQTWPWLLDIGAMPMLMAFFAAELFLVLTRARRVTVQWLVYALIAFQALLVPLASEGHGGVGPNRYLDPLGPVAAAVGAAFAVEMLRRFNVPVRLAGPGMALVVLLTAVPVLFNLAVGPYHRPALERARATGELIAARAAPGDILASTDAAVDAWTCGLHAIYLPTTPEDLQRMRTMIEVDWVRVRALGGDLSPRTAAWEPIITGEAQLEGYERAEPLPDGSVLLRRSQVE